MRGDRFDLRDISGLLKTVSTVPSGYPKRLYDSVVIYVNGTDRRLYVYESAGKSWRYATLT